MKHQNSRVISSGLGLEIAGPGDNDLSIPFRAPAQESMRINKHLAWASITIPHSTWARHYRSKTCVFRVIDFSSSSFIHQRAARHVDIQSLEPLLEHVKEMIP